MTLDLTTDELREIQDALASEIRRMCEAGQTPQELEYQSLTHAWSARKKVLTALIPPPLPPWVALMESQVAEAIDVPRLLAEDERPYVLGPSAG